MPRIDFAGSTERASNRDGQPAGPAAGDISLTGKFKGRSAKTNTPASDSEHATRGRAAKACAQLGQCPPPPGTDTAGRLPRRDGPVEPLRYGRTWRAASPWAWCHCRYLVGHSFKLLL